MVRQVDTAQQPAFLFREASLCFPQPTSCVSVITSPPRDSRSTITGCRASGSLHWKGNHSHVEPSQDVSCPDRHRHPGAAGSRGGSWHRPSRRQDRAHQQVEWGRQGQRREWRADPFEDRPIHRVPVSRQQPGGRRHEWQLRLLRPRPGHEHDRARECHVRRRGQSNGPCWGPAISQSGQHVAFYAAATNLAPR